MKIVKGGKLSFTPQKIIIRGLNHALGDSLMTTPAIRALRNAYPDSRITLIVPKRVLRVFEGNPYINEIKVYDDASNPLSKVGFFMRLRKYRYDVAVLFQRAFEAAVMVRVAGVPVRVGYDSDYRVSLLTHALSEDGWDMKIARRHQIDYYLDLVRFITGEDFDSLSDRKMDFFLKEDEILKAEMLVKFKEFVVFAVGGHYGRAKLWFPDRWGEVGKEIYRKYGLGVVLIGSDADVKVAGMVEKELVSRRVPVLNLAGLTSLGEAAGVVNMSKVVVAVDSGTSHLAVALSKPTVVIVGPTNDILTGPFPGSSGVAVKHQVECSPCLERECPRGDNLCMRLITPQDVVDAVDRLIQMSE